MAGVRFDEEVLALPGLPVVARSLIVRGSNVDIGRAVAELASARCGLRSEAMLGDGRYVRARRTYFRRNYPAQARRMEGVADALGLHPDDDRFDFSFLGLARRPSPAMLGAASTYDPPWLSQTGGGTLSRWADVEDVAVGPLELYIMDWRPLGAAMGSVALHAGDLLSGAMQGINSAGLAVSAVGAGRSPADLAPSCDHLHAIGLHELQLTRFVLDTCRTIDEAQSALLAVRDFSMTTAARYLIADVDGRSFIYETCLDGRTQRIIDGGGDRQSLATPSGPSPRTWAWRCVIDQERRSLELSFRTAGSGVTVTRTLR